MKELICEVHGPLGEVEDDAVAAKAQEHRDTLGCYYPIKSGIPTKVDDIDSFDKPDVAPPAEPFWRTK